MPFYSSIRSRFGPQAIRSVKDGSSASSAAPSALAIKELTSTNTNGIYWIDLPTVGPKPIYCIMDSNINGGGWMMILKATTGTTFGYFANYWTTANVLNESETNRNNGDAKFHTFNYFSGKDFLALWPDIGQGGSISVSGYPWTWLQNNYNGGSRITPLNFFSTVGSASGMAFTNAGRGLFIGDAKLYSGWAAGVFSSQVDVRFYGFNYENVQNPTYGVQARVRWGFGFNENGEGLYPGASSAAAGSNDVSGGIGLDPGFQGWSAGDRVNCCQDQFGINRSARVEMYVR